jgi:hypothetical protein
LLKCRRSSLLRCLQGSSATLGPGLRSNEPLQFGEARGSRYWGQWNNRNNRVSHNKITNNVA